MGLVEEWASGRAESGRGGMASAIQLFQNWLRESGYFPSLEEAVVFQKQATGDDRYRIVDLALKFVKEKGGTYSTMSWRYSSVIRSFFYHCRAELPKVRVNFTPTRDATAGRLGLETLLVLLKASDLRDQATYLTLFQGLMDQHRFVTVFNNKGFELGEHIKEKGVEVPFRADFLRGRKNNRKSYNTWLGRDALQAWKLYFERERGWPKPGEPAGVDRFGRPLTKTALARSHLRLLRHLKFVNGVGEKHTRYGLGLHELRDLGRSILEKAKEQKFNVTSAEFWMGHLKAVDPLFYNKIWKLDPEYNLSQYKIAERYLNIISAPPGGMSEKEQKELRDLLREMAELKTEVEEIREARRREHTLIGINAQKT